MAATGYGLPFLALGGKEAGQGSVVEVLWQELQKTKSLDVSQQAIGQTKFCPHWTFWRFATCALQLGEGCVFAAHVSDLAVACPR